MVDDCFILKDKATGQSRKRGQALACFRHDRDCEAAIAGLHHRLTLPGASEPPVACRATSKDIRTEKDVRMPASANDGDTDKLSQAVSRDHLRSRRDEVIATERTSEPEAKRARKSRDNDSRCAPRKRKSPSRHKRKSPSRAAESTPRRSRERERHSNVRKQRKAERSCRGLDSPQQRRIEPKARNECGQSPSRGSLKRRSRSHSRSDSSAQGNGCNPSCDNDVENERPGVYIGVMRTWITDTYYIAPHIPANNT